MPDQELFDRAADGSLSTPEERWAQADMLLSDPRAEWVVHQFSKQWLDVVELLPKDPGISCADG